METFKGKNFTGKVVECHKDFIPYLQKMDVKAGELGLKIFVTSSLRHDANVKGAIVTPSKMSNHMVGFAIDCNIIDGKEWWNSKKLEKPSGKVLIFIDFCISVGIRWGGNFKKVDTVHFDYPLNLKNPKKWHEIYNSK